VAALVKILENYILQLPLRWPNV